MPIAADGLASSKSKWNSLKFKCIYCISRDSRRLLGSYRPQRLPRPQPTNPNRSYMLSCGVLLPEVASGTRILQQGRLSFLNRRVSQPDGSDVRMIDKKQETKMGRTSGTSGLIGLACFMHVVIVAEYVWTRS